MANDPKKNPAPPAQAPSRFSQEVKLDTFQYKLAEAACRETPLQGYLVDYVRMPDSDRAENPEWWCFVIHLTAPCNGIDRDGAVKKCAPGDIVLLSVPAKLRDKFGRMAIHPTHVHEVYIANWKQIDIGGGKKMWSPEIANTDPKSIKERMGFCATPVGPKADPRALLAEKNGSSDMSDAGEVPFG